VGIVAKNRRARYDYDILETIEAGVVLTGQEVKSCRRGNVNLAGSYVIIPRSGDVLLKNATIAPYVFASQLEGYDPKRDRKILLKKSESDRLQRALEQKGVTVIPLDVRCGRYVKLLLGVGHGRKRYDKRQKIKEKEVKRKLKKGEEY